MATDAQPQRWPWQPGVSRASSLAAAWSSQHDRMHVAFCHEARKHALNSWNFATNSFPKNKSKTLRMKRRPYFHTLDYVSCSLQKKHLVGQRGPMWLAPLGSGHAHALNFFSETTILIFTFGDSNCTRTMWILPMHRTQPGVQQSTSTNRCFGLPLLLSLSQVFDYLIHCVQDHRVWNVSFHHQENAPWQTHDDWRFSFWLQHKDSSCIVVLHQPVRFYRFYSYLGAMFHERALKVSNWLMRCHVSRKCWHDAWLCCHKLRSLLWKLPWVVPTS